MPRKIIYIGYKYSISKPDSCMMSSTKAYESKYCEYVGKYIDGDILISDDTEWGNWGPEINVRDPQVQCENIL